MRKFIKAQFEKWNKLRQFFWFKRKWTWAGVIVLAAIVVGVTLSFAFPAKALIDDMVNGILSGLSWIMLGIARIAIVMSVFFLKFFIELAGYNGYINAPTVILGWIMVRDLANMFFVVVLLVIAIGTILGLEQYEWKKTLLKFVFAAIFINFSKMICGLVIDIAHVFTITFINAIAAAAGGNLISMFKLDAIYSMVGADFNKEDISLEIFIAAATALFFALVVALTIGAYVVVMVARVIVLWVLIILSPLAFILHVIPPTQSYAQEWWQKFMKQVVVAPVMVFFLWLAFATLGTGDINNHLANYTIPGGGISDRPEQVLQNGSNNETQFIGNVEVNKVSLTEVSTWENMASLFVAVGFLLVGINVVQQLGVVGGDLIQHAQNYATSVAKIASGYALGRYLTGKGKDLAKKGIGGFLEQMPGGGQFWKRNWKRFDNFRTFNPLLSHIPILGKHRELYNEKMMARVDKTAGMRREAYLKDITKEGEPLMSRLGEFIPNLVLGGLMKKGLAASGEEGKFSKFAKWAEIDYWAEKGPLGMSAATTRRDFAEQDVMAAVEIRSAANKQFRMARNKRDLYQGASELIGRIENDHFRRWLEGGNGAGRNFFADNGRELGKGDAQLRQEFEDSITDESVEEELTKGNSKWDGLSDAEKKAQIAARKSKKFADEDLYRDFVIDQYRGARDGAVFESFLSEKGRDLDKTMAEINKDSVYADPSMGKGVMGFLRSIMPQAAHGRMIRNVAHAIYQKERLETMKEQEEEAVDSSRSVATGTHLAESEGIFRRRAIARRAKKASEEQINALTQQALTPEMQSAQKLLEQATAESTVNGKVDEDLEKQAVEKLAQENPLVKALYWENKHKTAKVKAEEAEKMANKAFESTGVGRGLAEAFAEAEVGKKLGEEFEKTIKDAKLKIDYDKAKAALGKAITPDQRQKLFAGDIATIHQLTGDPSVTEDQAKMISRFAEAVHYTEESATATKEAETAKKEAAMAHADAEDQMLGGGTRGDTLRMRAGEAEVRSATADGFFKVIARNSKRYNDASAQLSALDKTAAEKRREAAKLQKQGNAAGSFSAYTEAVRAESEREELIKSNPYAAAVFYEQNVRKIEAVTARSKSQILSSIGKTTEGAQLLKDEETNKALQKGFDDFVKTIRDEAVKAKVAAAKSLVEGINRIKKKADKLDGWEKLMSGDLGIVKQITGKPNMGDDEASTILGFAQAMHNSEEQTALQKELEGVRSKLQQAHADIEEDFVHSQVPDTDGVLKDKQTIRQRLAVAGVVSQGVANHLAVLSGNDVRYKQAAESLRKLNDEYRAAKTQPDKNNAVGKIMALLEQDEYAMDIFYAKQKELDTAREGKYKSDLTGEFARVEGATTQAEEEQDKEGYAAIGAAIFRRIKDFEIGKTIGDDIVKQLQNNHIQARNEQVNNRMREINQMDEAGKTTERQKLLEATDIVGTFVRAKREKVWAENMEENSKMMTGEADAMVNAAYLEELVVGKGMYSQAWVASAKRITDSAMARLDEPARGQFLARTVARLAREYKKAKEKGEVEADMTFQKYAYGVMSNTVGEANFDDGMDQMGEIVHLMESSEHYRNSMMTQSERQDFEAAAELFGPEGEFVTLKRNFVRTGIGSGVYVDKDGSRIMKAKKGKERFRIKEDGSLTDLEGKAVPAGLIDPKKLIDLDSINDGISDKDRGSLGIKEVENAVLADAQGRVLKKDTAGRVYVEKDKANKIYLDHKGNTVSLNDGQIKALTYVENGEEISDIEQRVAFTDNLKRVSGSMTTNTWQNWIGTGGRTDLVRIHKMVEHVMDTDGIENYDEAAKKVYEYLHGDGKDLVKADGTGLFRETETVEGLENMKKRFITSHKQEVTDYGAKNGLNFDAAADKLYRESLVIGDAAVKGLTRGTNTMNEAVEKSFGELIRTFSQYETRLNDMSYQYKQDAVKTGHFQLGGHQVEDARMKVVRMATAKEARRNLNATIRKTDIGTKANPHGLGDLDTNGYMMQEIYFKVMEESFKDKKRYQEISQVKKRTAESALGFRPSQKREFEERMVEVVVEEPEKDEQGKVKKVNGKVVTKKVTKQVKQQFAKLGDGRDQVMKRFKSMQEFMDKIITKDLMAMPEAFNNLMQRVVGMVDQFDAEAGLHFLSFEDDAGNVHTSTRMSELIRSIKGTFYNTKAKRANLSKILKLSDGVDMDEAEIEKRLEGIAEAFELKEKDKMAKKRAGVVSDEEERQRQALDQESHPGA